MLITCQWSTRVLQCAWRAVPVALLLAFFTGPACTTLILKGHDYEMNYHIISACIHMQIIASRKERRSPGKLSVILVLYQSRTMAPQTQSAAYTAVVSGASGFIGTELVKQLLEKGYTVRGTVRSTSNSDKTQHLTKLAEVSTRV